MTFYAASLLISATLLVLASSIAVSHAAEVRTKTTDTTTTKSTSLRTPVKRPGSRYSFSDVVGRVGSTTGAGAGSGPTDLVSGGPAACDFALQNCGDGKKCTVDSIWSGPLRCRWIVDDYDAVHDQCSTLHDNDGDTCDAEGICHEGVCRKVDTDDTSCTVHEISHGYPSGVRLCEAECDPIGQDDCEENTRCTYADGSQDGKFSCQVRPGPLAPTGANCAQSCDCKEGHVCSPSSETSYCNDGSDRCCVPICDLADEYDYCEGNTSCTPFYSQLAPGYERVGVCVFVQNP